MYISAGEMVQPAPRLMTVTRKLWIVG